MREYRPLDTALSFDPYFGEPDRDGDQGFEILPDGKVRIRIMAPNAEEVMIDRFGKQDLLTRVSDRMWEGIMDLGRGFQYFFFEDRRGRCAQSVSSYWIRLLPADELS